VGTRLRRKRLGSGLRRAVGVWVLTSLPRLKSWDSRPLILRPVGFALHRVPYVGISLRAL